MASCNKGTLAFITINKMNDGNFPRNHNNYHTAIGLWEPFSKANSGKGESKELKTSEG